MEKETKIVAIRYLWIYEGSDMVNLRDFVGTTESHDKFVEALLLEDVKKVTSEYLYEVDVTRIGDVKKLKGE